MLTQNYNDQICYPSQGCEKSGCSNPAWDISGSGVCVFLSMPIFLFCCDNGLCSVFIFIIYHTLSQNYDAFEHYNRFFFRDAQHFYSLQLFAISAL